MELFLAYYGASSRYAGEIWSWFYEKKEGPLQKFCRDCVPLWITANGVTYFRMALAGIVYHLYSHGMHGSLIWSLNATAVVTDVIDGPLARARKKETDWGSNIDPIADKMIILVVAYFELIHLMPTLYWIIFLGELASTVLRAGSYLRRIKSPAGPWGKAKMVMQSAALIPIFYGSDEIAVTIFFWALIIGTIGLLLQAMKVIAKN